MKPLPTKSALDSRSESLPLVSIPSGLLKVVGQQFSLLLNEGNLARTVLLVLGVQEVTFVSQKDLHSIGCHKEDVSRVFINLTLEVQDLFWASQDGCLGGFGLRVFLEELPVVVAVQLRTTQEQESDLIIVFLLQA